MKIDPSNRYECGCCGKKRYGMYMIPVHVPNRNNGVTFFCNEERCLRDARKKLKQRIEYLQREFESSNFDLAAIPK